MLAAIPEGHAEKLKNQLVLSLKYMSDRDPSGRNKYLLWSAKYLVNQLAKHMEKRVISREAGPNFGAPTVTPRYLGDEDPEDGEGGDVVGSDDVADAHLARDALSGGRAHGRDIQGVQGVAAGVL